MTSSGFIPVVPLRNTVLLPGVAIPLRIGRAKSIAAIKKAKDLADGTGMWIVAVAQKREAKGEPGPQDLYEVGTLAKIEKVEGNEERGFQALVRGTARFRIVEYREEEGSILATGEPLSEASDTDEKATAALLKSLKALAKNILALLPADTDQLIKLVDGIDDLGYLANLSIANIEMPTEKKQEYLETASLKERVLRLLELLQAQKDNLEVENEIRGKLSEKMGKIQRETILREQLETIREELGERDEGSREDYRGKIEKAGMPDDVKKAAQDEVKRLEAIGNQSPESHVIRNYLDLLVSLPWSKSSPEEIDLDRARSILEADHYGLEKIKKRILQHLAVMKLKKGSYGSILLFVGPPGVGKTSLGQSIARALGRKFVRGSLGGVRDDAEIRGHRRTYIGALPGRVIQGIKRAGENNPVFLLDELDKLSRSFQGDPASALLEVLDPEQNKTFLDHYLDVPFDLSKVFFIATANTVETIPGPLLDRMEVIELSGYTTAEKLHIAKRHLVPKQLEEHGLSQEQLVIGDEALLRMITHYTREAGVRELQRVLATACRASSERVLEKGAELPVRVAVGDLEEMLGPEKFIHEVAERVSPPGVVTGLAWTPQGGEILFIEASQMPGTGKLTLTGQLGDVMKESAQIALSLVRSRLAHVASGFVFEKNDIHVHVPSGAIPKDGPSAGVAMLVTIASLFSGRRVNPKLAMTGEITLRGAVMPVGGIKEKVIAAHRAGIERVILPKRNQKDLRDVPEEVRSAMKFEFVENISDVLRVAIGLEWPGKGEAKRPQKEPSSHSPVVA